MMTAQKINTKMLILCPLFSALITVGAFIRIPISYMDYFTMQTLFVMLAGLILGQKYGAVSCSIYVLIGLIGFPVFAAGGGFDYVLRPTFGYILGFIPSSFLIGFILKKLKSKKFSYCLIACIVSLCALYVVGLTYKYFILNFYIGNKTGALALILTALPLEIPSDILSCIFAAFLASYLNKINAVKLH